MAHNTTTDVRLGTGSFTGGGSGPSPPVTKTARYPELPLRRRLLVMLVLMAFVSIGVNILFILGMREGAEPDVGSRVEHTKQTEGSLATDSDVLLETTSQYRLNLLILLGITVFCFGAIIYLFIKRFFAPIDSIARAAREISVGNLDVTAPSNTRDEVGRLGQTVNGIAANYQEILLFSGTKLGNMSETVERLETMLKEDPNLVVTEEHQALLDDLKADLDDLTDVVKDFTYYQAEFDGKKVIAGS